jgi:hypothetical protein
MKFKTILMACAIGGALALAATSTAAYAQPSRPTSYKAPRILDGRPDLGGVWTNVTVTPFERPASFGARLNMTEEEVKAREARAVENVLYENQPTDPNAPPEDTTRKNCNGAGGRDCGYNAGWKDETTKVMRVGGEPRTSFLTTPDGRVPPRIQLTGAAAEAQRVRDARSAEQNTSENSANTNRRQNDNPETRGLGERCLAFGNVIGPMMPNGYYNNNIRISQSKDAVAIWLEMVHDVRIVRLGGKLRDDGYRAYFGESVGHYEGDTLVVETGNYHPSTSYRGSSPDMRMIEKFTRVAPNRLLYQFQIIDPKTWAQPWGGEYEFYTPVGDLYEYACHEGNYGLEGILAGARNEDKMAAEAAARQRSEGPPPGVVATSR